MSIVRRAKGIWRAETEGDEGDENNNERIMIQRIKSMAKSKGKHLLNVWQYSDAQPTEITLALVNLLLAPLATLIELGPLYFYQITLVCAGVYQLMCVANGDLKCRVRASIVTFGLFVTTLMMYVVTIGLSTPSHWGWLVLVFSSFGSLKRLKTEQLHRHG